MMALWWIGVQVCKGRKLVRWMMPSRQLSLEANFEIWFAQERSWLMVEPMTLNDNFLKRTVKKVDWWIYQMVLSERDCESAIFVRI